MYGTDPTDLAVPEGYRIGWKFCWTPTLHRGRSIWLRSIPVLQRKVTERSCGVSWDEWVTVAVLDDAAAGKPLPIDEF
jgi:hypothetical protein